MKKKYYTVNETISTLKKISSEFGLVELASYVQEKIIQPIIYIDSLESHACEIDGTAEEGNLFASGYCYLTAYWDVGDEIIGIFNRLISKSKLDIDSGIFKCKLVGEPKISSWQINHDSFKKVPTARLRLRISQSDAKIEAFVLLEPIKMANIVLTTGDFEKLKKILTEQVTVAEYEIKNAMSKKNQRKTAAKKNGEKSGATRKESSQWNKSRSGFLALVQENEGLWTANKLAEIGAQKNLDTRSTTTIGKNIRKDPAFTQYLKPNV